MKLDELPAALKARNVDPSLYDTDGPFDHPPETYVIRRRMSGRVGMPDYWTIYYSERGLETGARTFDTEAEACEAFLDLVCSDESARSKR